MFESIKSYIWGSTPATVENQAPTQPATQKNDELGTNHVPMMPEDEPKEGTSILDRLAPYIPGKSYMMRRTEGDRSLEVQIAHRKEHLEFSAGNKLIATRLSLVIEAIVPKFVPMIEEKAGNRKAWIDARPGFISLLVENIVREMVNNLLDRYAGENPKDALANAVDGMAGIVSRHFQEIKKEDVEAALKQKGKMREEALYRLFGPLSQDLLAILLPRGERDLPVPKACIPIIGKEENVKIYGDIEKKLFPSVFSKIYQSLILENYAPDDEHAVKDNEVLARPGGAALQQIAKKIARETVENAPGILTAYSKELAGKIKDYLVQDPKKAWIQGWISGLIKSIVKLDSPAVKQFYQYAEKQVESIALHALASLARNGEGNLISDGGGLILDIADEFFDENSKTLANALADPTNKNAELAVLFKPLVDRMLAAADIGNLKVPSIVKEKVAERLSYFVLDYYRAAKEKEAQTGFATDTGIGEKTVRELLVTRLFDSAVVEAELKNLELDKLPLGEVVEKKDLLPFSGVNEAVQKLENMITTGLGEKLRGVLATFAGDEKQKIAHRINASLFNRGLTKAEEKEVDDGLKELLKSGSPAVQHALDYSQKIMELSTFNLLAALVNNVDKPTAPNEDKSNRNILLPAEIIKKLLGVVSSRLPELEAKYQELVKAGKKGDDLEKEFQRAFIPAAKELTAMAGEGFDACLAVPESWKPFLRKSLEEKILPGVLRSLFTSTTPWYHEIDKNLADLKRVFPAGNVGAIALQIGDYVGGLAADECKKRPELVAGLVEGKAAEWMGGLNEDEGKTLRSILQRNIKEIGTSPEGEKLFEGVAAYTKAAATKIFANLGKRIHEMEHPDGKSSNKLLTELTYALLDDLESHFTSISEVHRHRDSSAHDIDSTYMHYYLEGAGLLHKGMEKNVDLTKAVDPKEVEAWKLETVYKPLAKRLIALSGMEEMPKDFPVPVGGEQVWDKFKTELFPQILQEVVNEIKKPLNIKKILLKGVRSLSEIQTLIANADADKVKEAVAKAPEDEMNRTCGKLVLALMKLTPHYFETFILDAKKIEALGEGGLGYLIRNNLEGKTLTGLIDSLLQGAQLPDPANRKTPQQLLAEERQVNKDLQKESARFISDQLKTWVRGAIESKWNKFQNGFDAGVKACFGEWGLKVKHFFDVIFRFIFIKVLGPVWNFLLFTVCWFFVDIHIKLKMREYVKSVSMPIHENLVYKSIDTILDVLEGKERPKRKPMTKEEYEEAREKVRQAAQTHAQQNWEIEHARRVKEDAIKRSNEERVLSERLRASLTSFGRTALELKDVVY